MKLLLIEDEKRAATYLEQGLSEHGYAVELAYTGTDGLHAAATGDHDLVILDVMLPGVDGFAVLSALRTSKQTPVLMLTARGQTDDKVKGFEMGADDYLAKPFDPRELALRIRTILRRTAPPPTVLLPQAPVQLGMRWFDAERSELRGPDGTTRLTGGEAALLAALARRPGEVLSREEIAAALGTPEAGERAVDVQVTRLRRKIEPDPREPRFLHTVRHRGYVLRPGP